MIIHKFIIHILDKNADTPVLNDFEGKISTEVNRFIQKSIKKVLKDDDLRKARFNNYKENTLRNCTEQMIYEEKSFVENSKEIASFLFDIMKINQDLVSCDLAICVFSHKEEKKVAILKLDYKKLYTHSVEFVEDKFNIQMVANEIAIQETPRIKQAVILGVSGLNDEYHLEYLDKDSEKTGDDSKFITEFLNVEKVEDYKYKTKLFKKATEVWINHKLSEDIKKAEVVRSNLNYLLKEKETVDSKEFIDKSLDDENLKQSFNEFIEEKNLIEEFEIDKSWVDKNLKKRSVKTNTGFEIKSDLLNFEDAMKYSIRKNENGTFDIIIKNINFCE